MEAANKGVIFQVRDYFVFNNRKSKKTNKLVIFFVFIELHCHVLGKSFSDEGSSIDFEN